MHRVAFRIEGILIVNIETKADTCTDGIDEAGKWRYRYHHSLGACLAGVPPSMTMGHNASGFTLS